MLRKADGYAALGRLYGALASAEGEDADTIVDALCDVATLAEAYLQRDPDTPESAALKRARALLSASRNGVCEHAPSLGESAAPGLRAESPADFEPPPAVPQRAADSGARDKPSVARAAPSTTRGGP